MIKSHLFYEVPEKLAELRKQQAVLKDKISEARVHALDEHINKFGMAVGTVVECIGVYDKKKKGIIYGFTLDRNDKLKVHINKIKKDGTMSKQSAGWWINDPYKDIQKIEDK